MSTSNHPFTQLSQPAGRFLMPLVQLARRVQRLALLGSALLLFACAMPQAGPTAPFTVGETTEQQVLAAWGAPWHTREGVAESAKVLEYSNQPLGHTNWMVGIGANGRVAELTQTLTVQQFAQITEGMPLAEVQRRLGRHLSTEYFYLKDQTHYDWRYTVGRQRADAKIFSVIFDRQMRVVATMSTDDPRTRAKGGYIPWR